MAMNFLDQLLNLAGLKLPEAKDRYDPSVYIQEESKPFGTDTGSVKVNKTAKKGEAGPELTGVAKYLAKKQQEENPKTIEETQTKADGSKKEQLSGVGRYLAKLEREAQENAEAEASALANMSGVERYLSRLEGKKIIPPKQTNTPEKKEEAQLTRVERYLSKQTEQAPAKKVAAPVKPVVKKTIQEAVPVETQAKQPAPVEKQVQATAKPAEKKVSKPSAPAKKEPVVKAASSEKIIDLTVNGEQCHATTSRGKRCLRATGLSVIERTINGKKYKFFACPQHNNKNFQPSPELLEN